MQQLYLYIVGYLTTKSKIEDLDNSHLYYEKQGGFKSFFRGEQKFDINWIKRKKYAKKDLRNKDCVILSIVW